MPEPCRVVAVWKMREDLPELVIHSKPATLQQYKVSSEVIYCENESCTTQKISNNRQLIKVQNVRNNYGNYGATINLFQYFLDFRD